MASNTDKFKRARRRFSTTVGPAGITATGTTLPLTDTTGVDADTAVVVVVDPGTASEEVIVGVLGSGQLTSCVRGKEGTPAVAHSGGAPVVMYFTETHWDDLIVGILQDHNQDGTHKVFAETNLVPTAAIQDQAVTQPKLATAAVTPDKLAQPYVCLQYLAANASIPTTTWVNITGYTTYYNNGYSVSSGAVTVPLTGLYRILVHNAYTGTGSQTDTLSAISVNSNTAPNRGWSRLAQNTADAVDLLLTVKLTANDVVRAWCYTGLTGASLMGTTIHSSSGDGSWFEIQYLGPSS